MCKKNSHFIKSQKHDSVKIETTLKELRNLPHMAASYKKWWPHFFMKTFGNVTAVWTVEVVLPVWGFLYWPQKPSDMWLPYEQLKRVLPAFHVWHGNFWKRNCCTNSWKEHYQCGAFHVRKGNFWKRNYHTDSWTKYCLCGARSDSPQLFKMHDGSIV